jgi:hypothetical protein
VDTVDTVDTAGSPDPPEYLGDFHLFVPAVDVLGGEASDAETAATR